MQNSIAAAHRKRTGDVLTVVSAKHEQRRIGQRFGQVAEKRLCQARFAPFAEERGTVEFVEHGPVLGRDPIAVEDFDFHFRLVRIAPFTADLLAPL